MPNKQWTGVNFSFTRAAAMLAYPDLMEARAFKAGDKPTFATWFLLRPDHADLPFLRDALRQAAINEWGAVPPGCVFPLLSGDEYANEQANKEKPRDASAYRGLLYLKSSTGLDKPPALAAVVSGVETNVPADPTLRKQFGQYFYGGVEAVGSFNFVAMDLPAAGPGRPAFKMVKAYLQSVCSLSRGDSVGAFNAGGAKDAASLHGAFVRGHISQVMPAAAAPGASAMG